MCLSSGPRRVAPRNSANWPSVMVAVINLLQLIHALDNLASDVVLWFDVNHGTALEHQVEAAFLDDFFNSLIQLRLELLEHVTISDSLGFVQLFGLKLEITGLLLEIQLQALAL